MGVIRQCYTTFSASFGFMLVGILYAWPSYTMEKFKSSNTTLLISPMSDMEISLLGSLPSLGSMVGALLVSPVIDWIGRRKGGIVFLLPITVSWTVIYLTSSSPVILTARFIQGISCGSIPIYSLIFISEITQDCIRGRLCSVSIMFFCLGSLVSYILGWALSYEAIILVNLVFSIISVIQVTLVVESPIYLIREERYDDARESIAKYRGGTFQSISKELAILKARITPVIELTIIKDSDERTLEEKKMETLQLNQSLDTNDGQEQNLSAFKFLFTSPSSRRAFTIVLTHVLLQVMMSVIIVLVYAKAIFAEAAPSLSGHACSVFFAVIMLCGILVGGFLSDRAGRRFLLIGSSILVALCMASLGFLLQTKLAPAWVIAGLFLAYCFVFNLGAGSIPFTLVAESFIPKVLGLASMLIIESLWLFDFIVIALLPYVNKLLGVHGTFYCFAAVATVNAVLGYWWIPETKGLSSEQIQEAYYRRKLR